MWSDFSQFLAMGGYGLYVWGSIGVCALVPVIEWLALRQRHAQLQRNSDDEQDTNSA